MEELCTAPGSTVNFTAFNPCSNAATDDYWHLTDTREAAYGNTQTYKVKKLADGKIWMVQDMKFGDKCGTDFTGSISNQTGKVSSTGTYYGDCTAATNTSTPSNRGYLYDWAAAINRSGAYYGSSSDVGCSGTATGTSGTAPGACQGICPVGWHIPTGNSSGEYQALHNAIGDCSTSNDDCWDASSAWEGVLGGGCNSTGSLTNQSHSADYWSSTYYNDIDAYYLYFIYFYMDPGTRNYAKSDGRAVRCVRNY
jgi:uncharacterized protein (TIGR02145 family)